MRDLLRVLIAVDGCVSRMYDINIVHNLSLLQIPRRGNHLNSLSADPVSTDPKVVGLFAALDVCVLCGKENALYLCLKSKCNNLHVLAKKESHVHLEELVMITRNTDRVTGRHYITEILLKRRSSLSS